MTFAADDFRAKNYDVFISYKHLDAAIRDALVEALQEAKLSYWWDAKLVSGAWRPQLADRINYCKLVVALWSENVAAAPDEVRDEMSQARGLNRLMALRTDKAEIPKIFREQNFMPFNGWADPAKGKAQLEAIIAEIRRRVDAPTYEVVETGKAMVVTTLTASPEFGDIPGAPDKLIGRDAELTVLRNAWASRTPNKVNAVVFHALGGAGKTALLRTFANDLLAAGGGGASRLYGWSAYSQGSGEQKRADADSFISKALGDFGWQGDLPKDPVERGRALAKLIQRECVLLLLDGLEPLQDAPNVNRGRFKDKGLAGLVKLLAGHNPGLVVLTTRQEVPELQGFGPVVINHEMDTGWLFLESWTAPLRRSRKQNIFSFKTHRTTGSESCLCTPFRGTYTAICYCLVMTQTELSDSATISLLLPKLASARGSGLATQATRTC